MIVKGSLHSLLCHFGQRPFAGVSEERAFTRNVDARFVFSDFLIKAAKLQGLVCLELDSVRESTSLETWNENMQIFLAFIRRLKKVLER